MKVMEPLIRSTDVINPYSHGERLIDRTVQLCDNEKGL